MKREVVDTVCELMPGQFLCQDLDGRCWDASPVLWNAEFRPKSILEEIVHKNLDQDLINMINANPGYPKYHTAVKSIELPYYENGKDGA